MDRATVITNETVEDCLDRANQLRQSGELDEAIAVYQRAIKLDPNSYQSYHYMGETLAQKGELEAAANSYNLALEINPDFFWSYHCLGKVLLKQGKLDEAIAAARQALELEPKRAVFHYQLGLYLEDKLELNSALVAYVQALELEPNLTEARHHLEAVLAQQAESPADLKPRDLAAKKEQEGIEVETLLAQGRDLMAKGDIDKAIAVYQQGIELDANAYEGYHFLGEALAKQNELETAEKCYRQASEINPDYYWSYHCLGLVLFWQGELDEAIAAARQALESEPNRAVFHYQLGMYLERKLDLDRAIAAYSNALELEPNLTEARHHLEAILARQAESPADLRPRDLTAKKEQEGIDLETLLAQGRDLMAKGDIDKAISVFQQGIELDANSYECYHFLGEALAKKNELEKAEKCYRQAIEINPDYCWSYHNLGQVLFWQGKLNEAIAASRQAIELNKNQPAFYNQLGQALAKKEEPDEAISCYRNALVLQPDFWEAYHYLGEALLKQQFWTKAVDNYRRAIELNPNFSWSYQGLGDGLTRQNKWSEAAVAYRRAIELHPNFSWSYVYLVSALIHQEKWQEAEKYVSLGLSIYPDNPHLLINQAIVKSNFRRNSNTPDMGDELEKSENWTSSITDNNDPEVAKREFEKGEILSNQAKWEQAADAYYRSVQFNPYDHWYRFSLGIALFQQGKYDKAALVYRSAIELKSDNSWLYKCLAEALFRQAKWSEAADTYYQALKINPDDFWYCDNLGNALFKQGKWSEAEIAYKKSIGIHPYDAQLQIKLGQTLLKQQKWAEAAIATNQALTLLPHITELYENLRTALSKQGKDDEANATLEKKNLYEKISKLRQAIRLNPPDFSDYKNLAEALAKLGKWDAAAIAYRQTIELDTNQTWWLQGCLGEALLKIGKWQEAEPVYRRAIQLCPHESPWLYKAFAEVLFKQGKWAEAIANCSRAVELNPDEPQIYDYYGQALLRLKKWSQATDVYYRALELHRNRTWYCAQFYTQLGKALAQQEKWQEALDAYHRSIELNRDEFGNYHDLGDAFFQLGQWSEAIDAYRQALEQYPHLSWSHKLSFVGWSYHEQGNNLMKEGKWWEAETAYRKAIELNADYFWHYHSLGEALIKQQKWEQATEVYHLAAELKGNSVWFSQQNPEQALRQISVNNWGLVICIYTCTKNNDKQQAIRDTWLKEVIKNEIPYFFVVGKPSDQSYIEGDILYVDAPDTYEHLPRKTYKLFEFIHNHTFYSYAMKVDDDCYVNVNSLLRCNFETQDYTGKILGTAGELDKNWHIGKTSDPNYGEYAGEYKGTWADGASGYFLNRYAMKKLLEYSNHKEIGFELYEDKLVGDILREFDIKPIHPDKYRVGVEKCDRHTGHKLAFEAGNETPYPHQSNDVVVFHSDNAPNILYKIHQNYYDDEYQNRRFLRNFYWFQPQYRNHICLERVDNKEISTTLDDVLCFLVERNESLRLPYLLSYYRSKGISKFFIVDNHSTDDTLSYLLRQPDVYLWHTTRSYAGSKWGVDWVELLLQNYGVNHWCLLVDADEILYYPDCETKNIRELCHELDRDGKQALSTILLDMYSKKPLKEAKYTEEQNFLDVCSYFDRKFYTSKALNGGPEKNVTAYFGGLRGRIFGNDQNSFCINKTPLVKYDYTVRLYEGFHWIGNVEIASQTGCLLHFKYFSTFHDYAKREAKRGEHWNGGSEYMKYARKLEENPHLSFYDPGLSVELKSSQNLIDLGVIKRGK